MKTEPPDRRRLNPYAFPSETDTRFVLLVVAALLLAINLSQFLIAQFFPDLAVGRLFAEDPQYPAPGDPNLFEQTQAGLLKRSGQALTSLSFPTGLIIAIFALATLIYRTHPGRIRRQKDLEPLPQNKDPTLQHEIAYLAGVAGISPAPAVEIGKGLRAQSGQAFGLRNQYVLRLDGGLRLMLRKAPDAFRAIILHEMAHIANRDIGRTYFAQSLWIATILLTIVPLALGLGANLSGYVQKSLTEGDINRLRTVSLPTMVIFCFQTGATLAIVALIRAGLLRVREMYADWRAAAWGAEASLSDILSHNIAKENIGRRMGLWRLHPTAQERLAVLQDPNHLFQVTPDLSFVVGVLLAFIVGGMYDFVLPAILVVGGAFVFLEPTPGNSFLVNSLSVLALAAAFLAMVVMIVTPILGIAYLFSQTVGLQVQREALFEMTVNRRDQTGYLRLWIPATLLALGLEAGFYLTPFAKEAPWVLEGANVTSALLTIPWLLGVMGLTWLWLLYVRFLGWHVLGSHVGATPPKWKRRFLVLALSGLLGLLYLPILVSRLLIMMLSRMTIPGQQAFLTPDNVASLGSFIFITLILALLSYAILFGASWMLVQIGRLIRPLHCPSCKKGSQQKHAVGKVCEHCGHDLAPWLFAI